MFIVFLIEFLQDNEKGELEIEQNDVAFVTRFNGIRVCLLTVNLEDLQSHGK